jgi:hypothetical protein
MQPVLRGSDGNFLVRCRAASIAVAAPAPVVEPAPCPTLVVGAERPRTKSEAWPPASEPWTNANPWPPASTAGAAAPAPSPAPELDLGY